jgi:hypothetical protein
MQDRQQTGRIGGFVSWANTPDRKARTAPGRAAALARFEKQVDPDGTMDPKERALRADAAKSAFFAQMAYRSSQARGARARAQKIEREVEADIADVGATDEDLAAFGIVRDNADSDVA